MLSGRLLSNYGVVESIQELLNFNKFVPRPFRLVTIKRSSKHFGVCVALFEHAILGLLQRIEAIIHFEPVVVYLQGYAAFVKHQA